MTWTTADIGDLTGRIAVVTGANGGLGFVTARALAAHGATVVAACRDEGRCSDAVSRLREATGSAKVETELLDLADLDSVRAFAERLRARHDRLDILVNNAGVMGLRHRALTKQGFELQIGTNHLGHFALTGLVLPLMLHTSGSRVVTVSSISHETGDMDFDDLLYERGYTPYGAYSRSKLANLLFMLELDRRLRAAGAETISVGAHPGFTSTNLQATGPFIGGRSVSAMLTLLAVRVIGQRAAEGAEPQLYAATAGDVAGGDYFGPRYKIRGHPARSEMSPLARDERSAEQLWDVSQQLTGVDVAGVLGRAAGA